MDPTETLSPDEGAARRRTRFIANLEYEERLGGFLTGRREWFVSHYGEVASNMNLSAEAKLIERTDDSWTWVTRRKKPRSSPPATPDDPEQPATRSGIAPWWIVLGATGWLAVASLLRTLPGRSAGWAVGLFALLTVLALGARWLRRRGNRANQATTPRFENQAPPSPSVAQPEPEPDGSYERLLETRTPTPFPARSEEVESLDVQREILAELRKLNERD